MTVSPLRSEPIVISPTELKTARGKKSLLTILSVVSVVLVAALAVYVAVRTVRSQNVNRESLERQQLERVRQQPLTPAKPLNSGRTRN